MDVGRGYEAGALYARFSVYMTPEEIKIHILENEVKKLRRQKTPATQEELQTLRGEIKILTIKNEHLEHAIDRFVDGQRISSEQIAKLKSETHQDLRREIETLQRRLKNAQSRIAEMLEHMPYHVVCKNI